MATFQKEMYKSASLNTINTQDIYLGIDSGNGRLKPLSGKGYSLRIPSLLYFPHSKISVTELDNESTYLLHEGVSKSDLWGKLCSWEKSLYIAPDSYISTILVLVMKKKLANKEYSYLTNKNMLYCFLITGY